MPLLLHCCTLDPHMKNVAPLVVKNLHGAPLSLRRLVTYLPADDL